MGLHDLPLVGVQRGRLVQDPVGDPDLADVMEQRAPLEVAQLTPLDAELPGEPHGVAGHPTGVPLGLRVAAVQGVDQAVQHVSAPLMHPALQLLVEPAERLVLLADEPVQSRVVAGDLDGVDHLRQHAQHLGLRPWLGHQPMDLNAVDRLHRGPKFALAGDQDPPGAGLDHRHPLEKVDAVDLRHAPVGQDHLNLVGRQVAEGGQRLIEDLQPVVGVPQRTPQCAQLQGIVVEVEDACRVGHPPAP